MKNRATNIPDGKISNVFSLNSGKRQGYQHSLLLHNTVLEVLECKLSQERQVIFPQPISKPTTLLNGAMMSNKKHNTRPPFPCLSSVQFSCSVMSSSLRPHGLQHARLPCPSPAPRVYSNSCPMCRCCHPTISSSITPFSSLLQFFPASGSFQMSQVAKVLEFQLQHQSFQ